VLAIPALRQRRHIGLLPLGRRRIETPDLRTQVERLGEFGIRAFYRPGAEARPADLAQVRQAIASTGGAAIETAVEPGHRLRIGVPAVAESAHGQGNEILLTEP